MSLLKRLSDGIWSYISPRKTNESLITPQTEPCLKKPSLPARRGSLRQVIGHTRSMSPVERVDNWRLGSSSIATDSVFRAKKKRPLSPSTASAERRKWRKVPYAPMGRGEMFDDRSDVDMDDAFEYEDADQPEDEYGLDEGEEDDISSRMSNIRVAKSPSPEEFMDDEEDVDVDETLVVSEQEYDDSIPKRKIIDITAEQENRHVSSEELRAQGWDDEHIILVQKIAMRGYEPLLPHSLAFGMRYMPAALFAENDNAFISSVRGKHFRGEKALEKLFELGGYMRSAFTSENGNTPEKQVRKHVLAYTKFMNQDADFDMKTVIPLIALEMRPADTPASVLQENARRKLERLANKYRAAFRARHSIENSPSSKASTQYTYTLPTLYAIIASHTLVALVAYRPEDAEPDIKTVAFFDFKDKDYDVWNALAIAVILCHARNVQLKIGEETGLGIKGPDWADDASDPDA